jgi:hypothetical protein
MTAVLDGSIFAGAYLARFDVSESADLGLALALARR